MTDSTWGDDDQGDADLFADVDERPRNEVIESINKLPDAEFNAVVDAGLGMNPEIPENASTEMQELLAVTKQYGFGGFLKGDPTAEPAERERVDFHSLSTEDFNRVSAAMLSGEQLAAGDPLASLVAGQLAARNEWEGSLDG